MLYKGKHDGYYLYELTDTDLILKDRLQDRYLVGDVLLFKNKKDVALGAELIKADDLPTALAYLDTNHEYHSEALGQNSQESLISLKKQLAETKASIAKRDDLLRDLAADLESQRYSNKMLIAQLETLREQISLEQLTRNEVLDDLEVVSAETYRKDRELQDAIDAKTQLEQELAERICELLELDSANTELQRRLQYPGAETSAPESQVLTMPTGKQIHVYHEFPDAKKKARSQSTFFIQGFARVLGLLLIGVLLFIAGSVLATAKLNGLSLGEALDFTLKTLLS